MMKTHRKHVAFLLVLGLAFPALALDVPLKYQRHPDEMEEYRPGGYGWFEKSLKAPPGDWKLPTFVSKQPVYGLAKLGDQERLFVVDKQAESSDFYNRLYFDANANRDLTDDPVIDGTTSSGSDGRYRMAGFPRVDTEVVVDGTSLPYSFLPHVSCYFQGQAQDLSDQNDFSNFNLGLRVSCFYEGFLDLGGRRYTVWLEDTNGTGRFNDAFSSREDASSDRIYPQGDGVYLAQGSKLDYYDRQPLGDRLLLNGTLFSVRISTAEGKMTLTPVEGDLTPLRLASDTERISLYTRDGKHCVMAYRPGTEIRLPAGDYRLLAYQMLRKDDQGDLWRLNAGATTKSGFAEVRQGETAELPFGEPYVPTVSVPEWSRQNMRSGVREADLAFAVKGAGAELLTDLARIEGRKTSIPMSGRNTQRPKEPTYKIAKPDGELATQGQFEYG